MRPSASCRHFWINFDPVLAVKIAEQRVFSAEAFKPVFFGLVPEIAERPSPRAAIKGENDGVFHKHGFLVTDHASQSWRTQSGLA